jgi:hypothetical protein
MEEFLGSNRTVAVTKPKYFSCLKILKVFLLKSLSDGGN